MEEGAVKWVMGAVKGAKLRRLCMPSESLLFRRRNSLDRGTTELVQNFETQLDWTATESGVIGKR
jgi:hypothetical protein